MSATAPSLKRVDGPVLAPAGLPLAPPLVWGRPAGPRTPFYLSGSARAHEAATGGTGTQCQMPQFVLRPHGPGRAALSSEASGTMTVDSELGIPRATASVLPSEWKRREGCASPRGTISPVPTCPSRLHTRPHLSASPPGLNAGSSRRFARTLPKCRDENAHGFETRRLKIKTVAAPAEFKCQEKTNTPETLPGSLCFCPFRRPPIPKSHSPSLLCWRRAGYKKPLRPRTKRTEPPGHRRK